MGYFRGLTATLYRRTEQGERVYVPRYMGRGIYRVSDGDAKPIGRRFGIFFVGLIVVVVLVLPLEEHFFLSLAIAVPAALAARILFDWFVTRSLPAAGLSKADLAPVDRRQARIRSARAFGGPMLVVLSVAMVAIASAAVWKALSEGGFQWWVVAAALAAIAAMTLRDLNLLLATRNDPRNGS